VCAPALYPAPPSSLRLRGACEGVLREVRLTRGPHPLRPTVGPPHPASRDTPPLTRATGTLKPCAYGDERRSWSRSVDHSEPTKCSTSHRLVFGSNQRVHATSRSSVPNVQVRFDARFIRSSEGEGIEGPWPDVPGTTRGPPRGCSTHPHRCLPPRKMRAPVVWAPPP